MKKFLVLLCALTLAASFAIAQATNSSSTDNDSKAQTSRETPTHGKKSGEKHKKEKKDKKNKHHKKSSDASSTSSTESTEKTN